MPSFRFAQVSGPARTIKYNCNNITIHDSEMVGPRAQIKRHPIDKRVFSNVRAGSFYWHKLLSENLRSPENML